MRYIYGMRLRGFQPWGQPMDGFVERLDAEQTKYHDFIVYDRPLTETEIRNYELDFIMEEN